MANRFEFFFTRDAILSLLRKKIEGIVVSGEVIYQSHGCSSFVIQAEGMENGMLNKEKVSGCPMPCRPPDGFSNNDKEMPGTPSDM